MQPEPIPGRRPTKAWITAALGISLVSVTAIVLVMTAVFHSPDRGTVSAGDVSSSLDSASADSASGSASASASASADPYGGASPSASASPAQASATPTLVVTTKPPVAAKAAKPRTTAPTQKLTGEAAYEAEVLTLVNQERAKAGCKALTADSRLAKAAKAHSADMAARNYFDHTTPEGVAFSTRITNAGYRWSTAAENIASGQKDPASVMKAWMNSAGHRANILNCAYRNLGVGLAYNASKTPYWTQDFGTPA